LSKPGNTLVDPSSTKLDALSYPLGRFQIREYDITSVKSADMPSSFNSTSKITVATRFSKLEWDYSAATEDSKAKRQPKNTVHHGSVDSEMPLAEVTSLSLSTGKRNIAWTMAFDDSQSSLPTGLVVDMVTQEEGNQSYLMVPAYNGGKSINESGLVTSLNNRMAPLLMERATSVDGMDAMYKGFGKEVPPAHMYEAFGLHTEPYYHELASPYGIYNWELGFHVVLLLMERLLATQQLDLALQMARYVFDPSINGSEVHRCWKFPPFATKDIYEAQGQAHIIDSLDLQNSFKLTSAVQEWRKHPFAPHVVARNWSIAYMKRMARKYIEILIASGYQYFRQSTLESIPLAIQRYVEASHLFGARPKTF